jgi:hypothetical protein
MCFPSKKQGANFDTEDTTKPPVAAKKPTDTKAAVAAKAEPTATPAPAPATTTTTTTKETIMAGPKIAIVTYSMYGHINKSTFAVSCFVSHLYWRS